ncbi:MAG: hypothetical protein WD967_02715, partial [Candidatus Levyibacteriota bacterium]
DEKSQSTKSQRLKEEANDYRYFPEPDIPPIKLSDKAIEEIKSTMPELPNQKLERFKQEYGLPFYVSEILTRNPSASEYFEEAARIGKDYKVAPIQTANTIINKKINTEEILPAKLVKIILEDKKVEDIPTKELKKIIAEVISENEKAVREYKSGKENALQFLIGQTMKKIGKKVDPSLVKNAILEILK